MRIRVKRARGMPLCDSFLASSSKLALVASIAGSAVAGMILAASPASAQTTELQDIVVQGQTNQAASSNAASDAPDADEGPAGPVSEGDTINRGTSGIDGYIATGTSTATKTNTPLIDIPQTISIVTKEFAEDTGSEGLGQALLYVPGVTVQQGEGHRDQITIRGQETTADFFTDGVRDDIQYYRDLYNVEAVEVLKGASALAFGRGGAGGIVNRVTKRANGKSIYEGTATVGSFDKKYFTADVGGAVSDSFAVRLNAMYEDSGGFRDFFEKERVGINPTVTLKVSPKTTLSASYEYRSDDRTVDRGVTSLNGRPLTGFQNTFFGNPDVSYTEFEGHVATATLEHEFTGGLQLRSHVSYNHYDKLYQNIMPVTDVNPATGQFDIGGYQNDTDRESIFTQTDLSYVFNTGSMIRHTVVGGFEYSQQDQFNFRNTPTFAGGGSTFTVTTSNPTNFTAVSFDQVSRRRDSEVSNTSFYIQDQMEVTKYFELIGGVRFDRFEIDFVDRRNGGTDVISRTDTEYSPRVGAVVKPMDGLSLYASWSKSFLPTAGDQFDNLTVSRSELAPEEFENSEIGFKWEAAPRLFLTAALYNLDRTNQRVNVGGFDTASGETNTKGFEIGLSGYVTDAWQINGGYTNQRSKIEDAGDNIARVGNSVEGVPRHQFSMWNKYQFNPMFAAAFGVIHQSDHFAEAGNNVTVPGYTRVDAALFVDISENWEAQLNVENIFDEDYFASAHNDENISPGAPRSAYVTVKAKF